MVQISGSGELVKTAIAALGMEERSSFGDTDAAHGADDDGMAVSVDELLDLAVDGGERALQRQRAGEQAAPARILVARDALDTASPGEAVGDGVLVVGEDVHAVVSVTADDGPGR